MDSKPNDALLLLTNLINDGKKVATILSIRGGGLRGIIPATYLEMIEEKLGKQLNEVFNLVAGTSTGGLIAYGLNKYTASDIVKIYENEGGSFFQKRRCNFFGLFGPKYKGSALYEKYREHFGEEEISNIQYDSLITFYDISTRKCGFFKSHRAKLAPRENYKIADVLACTSAAPTYFEPHTIEFKEPIPNFSFAPSFISHLDEINRQNYTTKTIKCIDGGVVANDPIACAMTEAFEIYPNADAFLVVSLTTGCFSKSIDPKTLIS